MAAGSAVGWLNACDHTGSPTQFYASIKNAQRRTFERGGSRIVFGDFRSVKRRSSVVSRLAYSTIAYENLLVPTGLVLIPPAIYNRPFSFGIPGTSKTS